MNQFEFRIFPADQDGVIAEREIVEIMQLRTESAAKSKAGQFAKKHNGPVDLAYAGGEDWNERYITTASPSEFHAAGYRCERLS